MIHMLVSQHEGIKIVVIRILQVSKKAEEKCGSDEEENGRCKKNPNQTSRDEKVSEMKNRMDGKKTS